MKFGVGQTRCKFIEGEKRVKQKDFGCDYFVGLKRQKWSVRDFLPVCYTLATNNLPAVAKVKEITIKGGEKNETQTQKYFRLVRGA